MASGRSHDAPLLLSDQPERSSARSSSPRLGCLRTLSLTPPLFPPPLFSFCRSSFSVVQTVFSFSDPSQFLCSAASVFYLPPGLLLLFFSSSSCLVSVCGSDVVTLQTFLYVSSATVCLCFISSAIVCLSLPTDLPPPPPLPPPPVLSPQGPSAERLNSSVTYSIYF